MQNNWFKIIASAKAGDTAAFNKVVTQLFIKAKGPLVKLTGSEKLAWEVHLLSMTKFWERFVLKGEQLPQKNIEGYIHLMARNAFLDIKRRDKKEQYIEVEKLQLSKISLLDKIVTPEMHDKTYYQEEQESKSQQLKSLEKAISQVGNICRQIIERNIFESHKLKVVKEQLNYPGQYQAIVEKKKRCIKKLTKLFFLELIDRKNTQP